MAKFCIHCGKPLEDGEVCSCQQNNAESTTPQPEATENQTPVEEVSVEAPVNPTPQQTVSTENAENNTANTTVGNATKNTTNSTSSNEFVEKLKLVFTKFTDYFKSPTGTVKEFAAKNDSLYGILMICTNLIVLFLLMLILINAGSSTLSNIPLIGILGGFLSNSAFSIALMFTAIFAAYYFAMAGMLVLTTKSMFKGTMTFRQSVSIVGVNAFINAVVLIVAVILMLISPTLGVIALYLGFLYSSLMEYVSYIEMADISSDKKAYALLISLIGVVLAVFITSTVMGSIVGASMSSSIGGGFGNDFYDYY